MSQALTKTDVVSSEDEPLILVDSRDRAVGELSKSACHDGSGVLHRAFSLFIFDSAGRLLLQRRARGKRLWPGYWSNSCCSHPRVGEDMPLAVSRRLNEELGLEVALDYLYKFEYVAHFEDLGTEHELCWVYVGQTDAEPVINTTEIMDWCWIGAAELDQQLTDRPEAYTPWLKLEWQRLTGEYADRLPAGVLADPAP